LHTMVETWEIHGRFMENNGWSWNITITITYYNRWYNQLYMQLEWLIVGLPDLSFHLWPMKNRTVWLTSGWNVVPYFQTKGDKCRPDEDYHFTVSLSTSSRLLLPISFKGYPLVNKHSYWKWPFIVDLPIKNGDFP
jgi:hypothetical protein